jgi:YggT family protein
MNTLNTVLQFLISTISTLFLLAVLLRLLLQRARADFYNPLCQAIVKITNPLLVPMRRIIPGLWGWDMAAVVLAFIVQLIALILLAWLMGFPVSSYIIVVTIARLLKLTLQIYFYAILLRAVLSWFSSNPYQQNMLILIQLTEPILHRLRRYIPLFSGLDFSPLVALLLIQVLLIAISHWVI